MRTDRGKKKKPTKEYKYFVIVLAINILLILIIINFRPTVKHADIIKYNRGVTGYAVDYIQRKYGIDAKVTGTHNIKTEGMIPLIWHRTNQYIVHMKYNDKDFDVYIDNSTNTITPMDNYQYDEICQALIDKITDIVGKEPSCYSIILGRPFSKYGLYTYDSKYDSRKGWIGFFKKEYTGDNLAEVITEPLPGAYTAKNVRLFWNESIDFESLENELDDILQKEGQELKGINVDLICCDSEEKCYELKKSMPSLFQGTRYDDSMDYIFARPDTFNSVYCKEYISLSDHSFLYGTAYNKKLYTYKDQFDYLIISDVVSAQDCVIDTVCTRKESPKHVKDGLVVLNNGYTTCPPDRLGSDIYRITFDVKERTRLYIVWKEWLDVNNIYHQYSVSYDKAGNEKGREVKEPSGYFRIMLSDDADEAYFNIVNNEEMTWDDPLSYLLYKLLEQIIT